MMVKQEVKEEKDRCIWEVVIHWLYAAAVETAIVAECEMATANTKEAKRRWKPLILGPNHTI
jgi:hypothetical protein